MVNDPEPRKAANELPCSTPRPPEPCCVVQRDGRQRARSLVGQQLGRPEWRGRRCPPDRRRAQSTAGNRSPSRDASLRVGAAPPSRTSRQSPAPVSSALASATTSAIAERNRSISCSASARAARHADAEETRAARHRRRAAVGDAPLQSGSKAAHRVRWPCQRARVGERVYLRPDSAGASWDAQVFEDHPDGTPGRPRWSAARSIAAQGSSRRESGVVLIGSSCGRRLREDCSGREGTVPSR